MSFGKKIAKYLRQAATLISGPGAWLQNEWSNQEDFQPPTAFCALGVMSFVTNHGLDSEGDPYNECKAALGRFVFGEKLDEGDKYRLTPRIIDWNNSPNRTQREVVDAFIGAAEMLEKDQITLDTERELVVT